MTDPIRNDDSSLESNGSGSRRLREMLPPERPYILGSSSSSSWREDRTTKQELNKNQERDQYLSRRPQTQFESWPERVPEPPAPRSEAKTRSLFARFSPVVLLAALLAIVIVLNKPILQAIEAVRGVSEPAKSEQKVEKAVEGLRGDRLSQAAPPVPAASAPGAQPTQVAPAITASIPQPPPTTVPQPAPKLPGALVAPAASAPTSVQAQAEQRPQLPPQEAGPTKTPVRGVTDTEIRFGISAPFSGSAKELGQNMKLGIEAAFRAANEHGGVHGRQLRLVAADDGYEPARTAETMKQLYEKDQVFGVVGNVGTPTATVALPYALDRKMLFFGAFTGAGLLRNDPPDRYVFNYRASYAEETAAVVHYLVKVKRLKPIQIAVFAQQDAYGDAGFAGVAKAIRSLGGDENAILRLYYQRNTIDVEAAVAQLQAYNANKAHLSIRAVIMVPTYRAAARFIEKTRNLYPGMIYTSVSFVGSTALASELKLLGSKYANGVIVTQVVPAVDGHSSLVLDYKAALNKFFPGEVTDYVSLEGYVMAKVLIAALDRNGRDVDTEKLVQTLENLHGYDIGLGTPVTFGRSEHQGVHKVWGSQLDGDGHYQPLDLE